VTYVLLAALPAYLVNYLVYLDRRPSEARPFLSLTIGGLLSIIAAVAGMRSWTLYRERRLAAGTTSEDPGVVELTLPDPSRPDPIHSDPSIAGHPATSQAVTS
jgi:hypothetical protein